MRPINAKRLLLSSGILLAPALAFGDTVALTQLRMAADSASNSVYAPSGEAAASANERWSENATVSVPAVPSAVMDQPPVETNAPQAARPNLTAAMPDVPPAAPPAAPPKTPAPDPLPPGNPKGWQGFYLGFLGVESKSLAMLSSTGKAAVPLLILLQPVVLVVGLVAGLLGLFGVHL